MCGTGAEYTPFSKLNNLVVICEPADGIEKHAHEKAVRMAGIKSADYEGKIQQRTSRLRRLRHMRQRTLRKESRSIRTCRESHMY